MKLDTNGLTIPDYLNCKFFQKALENGLPSDNVTIQSMNFTMGSSPGDNYTSQIYRVVITYMENDNIVKTISLIAKSIPKTQAHSLVHDLDVHGKERILYFDILPKIESLLCGTHIGPKCFYAVEEPFHTLVFEDLRTRGFTLGQRQHGLNESECKVVLEKLGKFHGASMYLLEKEPKLLEHSRFKYGFFTPETIDDPLMEGFFIDSLKTEISIVENWPGYRKFADKMKKIYFTFKERILALMQPSHDGVQVLNHGDLWVNNFMIKYSNENPSEAVDICFLDFQGSFVISPGIDLNYFLNTSVQFEVLKSRRNALIEDYYYNSLKSTLVTLGHKTIPSLDQIKTEIRRKEFYGFVSAVGVLPVVSLDESQSGDCSLEVFTNKETAEKKRLQACKSKRFEQIMKYMLERADGMGVLD